MRKRGSIEPVIYFRNHRDPVHPPGYLVLAPYTEFRTPEGYTREEAGTLPEVDKLYKILLEQEFRDAEREFFRDAALVGPREQAIRDRLYARMTSDSTPPYERDYIREWLKLRDEKKREKYAAVFEHRKMFLHAREMDSHGRAADSERVDHVDVK